MTRDEAEALAAERNREPEAPGRWFAREGEQGWRVVLLRGAPRGPTRAGQAEKPPAPPTSSPGTLPGGVNPGHAGG